MKKTRVYNIFPLVIFVTLGAVLFLLQIRVNKAVIEYNLAHNSPKPSTSPISSYYLWTEPTPSPYKQAKSLEVNSIILYPDVEWQAMGKIPKEEVEYVETLIGDKHQSYEKWQAHSRQDSGQASSWKYFRDSVYAYYQNELGKLNWYSQDVADGTTGAIRRLHGIQGATIRDLILKYDLSNNSGDCGSGGCLCPCTYTYTLYLSSTDKSL